MKLPREITAAYGGRIRTGKAVVQGNEQFGVHFIGPNPSNVYDQGTWTNLFERDEGITWIRGTYTLDSPEAKALLVAAALT